MATLRIPHECCTNYLRTIKELKLLHNQTLGNLKTEMESERILLELEIGKLKQNIADIEEKSRLGQKQLHDLQTENTSLRGEITALQGQLRTQEAGEECVNCQSLGMAVGEKALQLIEREKSVEELQRFCWKFCKRLTKQDQLLALMSDLHIGRRGEKWLTGLSR